jgi:uncharacterized membrane protein
MEDDTLSRALGWFGIGLGTVQLLAPRRFGRSIGVDAPPWLLRLIGLREIASGAGILVQREPAPWIEARATGDLMDLVLLGLAYSSRSANRDRVAAAVAATAGITALDVLYGALLDRGRDRDVNVSPSVVVECPREPLYAFWRKLENLPLFMGHLESVRPIGPNRWHWAARGPLRTTVEWVSQIIDDRPNELIAWRSVEGSGVDNWGAVIFEPVGDGGSTLVHAEMGYRPPRGELGAKVARLFGRSPERQASADLVAFKRLMEAGRIAAAGDDALEPAHSERIGQPTNR